MEEEAFADGVSKRMERVTDAMNELSDAFIEFSLAHVEFKMYVEEVRANHPALFDTERYVDA